MRLELTQFKLTESASRPGIIKGQRFFYAYGKVKFARAASMSRDQLLKELPPIVVANVYRETAAMGSFAKIKLDNLHANRLRDVPGDFVYEFLADVVLDKFIPTKKIKPDPGVLLEKPDAEWNF